MGIGQALHRAGTASLYQLMSRSYKDPHFIKQKRIYLVVQSVASRISEQKLVWPFAVRHKWLSGMDFLLSSKNQAVGSTKIAWKRPVTKVVPRVLLRASWSKDLIAAGLLRFFQITYTQQCNFFFQVLVMSQFIFTHSSHWMSLAFCQGEENNINRAALHQPQYRALTQGNCSK